MVACRYVSEGEGVCLQWQLEMGELCQLHVCHCPSFPPLWAERKLTSRSSAALKHSSLQSTRKGSTCMCHGRKHRSWGTLDIMYIRHRNNAFFKQLTLAWVKTCKSFESCQTLQKNQAVLEYSFSAFIRALLNLDYVLNLFCLSRNLFIENKKCICRFFLQRS